MAKENKIGETNTLIVILADTAAGQREIEGLDLTVP